MTSGASNFLLNIVELQNVITSSSGLSPVASLSNTVAQIQQMVNVDQKRLYVNTISQYNTSPIQVLDSMNFASNAELTLNGATVMGGGGGSYGAVSSIGYISSFTNYYNPSTLAGTAISLEVGGSARTPLSVSLGGTTTVTGELVLAIPSTPTLGYYLTCMDGTGRAEWHPPGSISDRRMKLGIRNLEGAFSTLQHIQGVHFRWKEGGSNDIGFIAQDVAQIVPEAVHQLGAENHMMLHYHKIVPILVEAVKELGARISTLEALSLAADGLGQRP
jgi:hypothetical protein